MSRIAKKPVILPSGVQIAIENNQLRIKGPKGEGSIPISSKIEIAKHDNLIYIKPVNIESDRHAGTTRALLANMVKGVTSGFQRKLELVGVGYRAQMQGRKLSLNLGYSHSIVFDVPDGITMETPSPTEIIVRGVNCQLVGQVAANIRAYRPPEPYKGKGVKYANEVIIRKEAKKK